MTSRCRPMGALFFRTCDLASMWLAMVLRSWVTGYHLLQCLIINNRWHHAACFFHKGLLLKYTNLNHFPQLERKKKIRYSLINTISCIHYLCLALLYHLHVHAQETLRNWVIFTYCFPGVEKSAELIVLALITVLHHLHGGICARLTPSTLWLFQR